MDEENPHVISDYKDNSYGETAVISDNENYYPELKDESISDSENDFLSDQSDERQDDYNPYRTREESMEKKRKVKHRFHNKIFFRKPTITEKEFEELVLDSGNFSVAGIWKPEWKEQMTGLKNPRSSLTNRNLCKSHKKVVCSMAFKSIKITYTPNYLVIQGSEDLVQATRRGLLTQNILDKPWIQPHRPDHVHSVIPVMNLSDIDSLSSAQASHILIQLLRAHSDVVSGNFVESDMPSRLYEQNSEHGDLMWQLFPWQCTIMEDIRKNGEGAKLVLKKLMADVYQPAMYEDMMTGANYTRAKLMIKEEQNVTKCKDYQVQ